MKSFLTVALLLLVACLNVFSQSGRRVTATPTPAPQRTVDETPQYSDSKPQRQIIPRNTDKFPGIGDGSGQKPVLTNSTASGSDDEVLRVETNLVTIPVSVFDRNGLYIPGLRQENFKIYEDGKEQEIAYFAKTDKPFTVVLLIDTSPSTAYKIEEIHQAAIAFVDNLEPQDSVMVIEFSQSVHVLTEATNSREEIYKGIRKARFGDGTSLYDAVDFTFKKRLSKIEGRKAIVLFTDGVDTTSRKMNYYKTIDEAEEADSLVFPIYYNTFMQRYGGIGGGGGGGFPFPGTMGGGGRGDSAAEYALGKQFLEDLAAVTGGRVFRPESTPGGLSSAFEGIAEELRRQYSIGYIPKDEGKPGQRKQIKVRVDRPNLVLRARDSYIVGASNSPAATATKPGK